MKYLLATLIFLSEFSGAEEAPKWYAILFDEQTQKENRYLLQAEDQILKIPNTNWRCLSPPPQSEYQGQVWIRYIQCMVKGSDLMVGGTATCLMANEGQPGSLNLNLHEGMDSKSVKFERAKSHKAVSLTLECKK